MQGRFGGRAWRTGWRGTRAKGRLAHHVVSEVYWHMTQQGRIDVHSVALRNSQHAPCRSSCRMAAELAQRRAVGCPADCHHAPPLIALPIGGAEAVPVTQFDLSIRGIPSSINNRPQHSRRRVPEGGAFGSRQGVGNARNPASRFAPAPGSFVTTCARTFRHPFGNGDAVVVVPPRPASAPNPSPSAV
jgi:hypothetical protein